jgi:uncharacterized protein YdaU (DUF1376 family)
MGAPVLPPSAELGSELGCEGAVNYYRRHIGDYMRDTAHLSLIEHGIYARLLDLYYLREGPLCAADIARLVGAKSKCERAALNQVLTEFFRLENDHWRQPRCDAEILAAREALRKAQQSGRNGAAIRWAPKRDGGPIPSPSGPHKAGNGVVVAPILQPPIEDSGDEASPGAEPPTIVHNDPRKALWDLGISLLGEEARSLIGKAIKRVGEHRVGEVLGQMAVSRPADPKPFFAKATQERGFVC